MEWLSSAKIAHRAYHNETQGIYENSLSAVDAAIAQGYAIECDVRLSQDGQVVVFHDETLERLTQGSGRVVDWTLRDLQTLTLGHSDDTIPTLKEVLERVNGKVPLLIEIKYDGDPKAWAQAVAEVLDDYTGPFAIQSFHPGVLNWFKTFRSHITRGQIASFFKDYKGVPAWQRMMLKRFWLNFQSRPHFVHYEFHDLPNRWMRKKKTQGTVTLAFTITSKEELDTALQHVDNVVFEGFER
jgi:glycerophosphoryl diester phosphodiesterase